MNVTYDPNADAMYIYLSNKKSDRTEEIADDFLVDFHGSQPVGIEVLGVSHKMPHDELGKLTVSVATGVLQKRQKYL